MSASVTQRGAVIDSPLPSIVKPIVRRAGASGGIRARGCRARTCARASGRAPGWIEGHCGCRFGRRRRRGGRRRCGGRPVEERQVHLAMIEGHDGRPWPRTLFHQFASFVVRNGCNLGASDTRGIARARIARLAIRIGIDPAHFRFDPCFDLRVQCIGRQPFARDRLADRHGDDAREFRERVARPPTCMCAIGTTGAPVSIAKRAPPVLYLPCLPTGVRVPSGNMIIHAPSDRRFCPGGSPT